MNGPQNTVEFRGGDLERKRTESFKKNLQKMERYSGMNMVHRFAHP